MVIIAPPATEQTQKVSVLCGNMPFQQLDDGCQTAPWVMEATALLDRDGRNITIFNSLVSMTIWRSCALIFIQYFAFLAASWRQTNSVLNS